MATVQQRLNGFMKKYTPEIAARAQRILIAMRKRLPGAIEMVYDNYNWLVIGFGPTERPSEAIFSIVLAPEWVTLCFLQGAGLPDPTGRLRGSGNVVRNTRLADVADLADPAVRDLMDAALARAKVKMDSRQRRKLIIKSISAKQRPRRPAVTKLRKRTAERA